MLAQRVLTESVYVLRFARRGLRFEPGQHITLGRDGDKDVREYSIYSRPQDDFLEVLIKETDPGLVSRRLRRLRPGDRVQVNGPFGFFTLPPERTGRYLAVATGTGIAPFHSMLGAYPELDVVLLHGIRHAGEALERADYPTGRYITCTSRAADGDFQGRVTDWLATATLEPDLTVYLCGNCEMIYAAYDQLLGKGWPTDRIRTEVYF